MLFNTIDFVFFLPIVIIGYFLLKPKYRWVLLLAASYYFYMSWKLEYVVLIMFSTLIDYYCGLQMGKRESQRTKRPFLLLSLITNLGLLFGFKYLNFFTSSANEIFTNFDFSVHIPAFDYLLPVGISFYTFQTLSYSIDVYLNKQKPERHLGYFALYVSFFPQLVAGPIERFSRLTPQLRKTYSFNYDNLRNGLRLVLFGLFAKMVVADNLAPIVDEVYKSPEIYNSFSIASAMVFYSFQIYCDFFGYSLIAIGSALIMGVRLMDNFKTPYLATSIADFWQRWHISLSTWFRDYLYFPLGGNRMKWWRWALNILVVFILSGFWHGANVTFLLWGLIFATFYLIENALSKFFNIDKTVRKFSAKRILLVLKTFVIVTFAWVFFRSVSITEAMNLITSLFNNVNLVGEPLNITSVVWIIFALFLVADVFLFDQRFDHWIGRQRLMFRWTTYSIVLFAIIVYAGVEDYPFIYFQF